MTAKRILIVTDEMEVGGSQRQIVHLLRGLDRERFAPTLLFFRRPSFLVDELRDAGVCTIHLAKSGRISPRFVWRLWRFLRREKFDLIHAYSLTAELWVRALLPLLPSTRFIASIRGLCLVYPAWQWQLKRWILSRADAVVSNSLAGAEVAAHRTGYSLDRIDIIPNGIDIADLINASQRDSARRLHGLPVSRPVALFVGRLVVEKNLPLLLDAMARLEVAERPLLLIAGDGPLAQLLDEQIALLELADDVQRLGERSDTRWLMQLADFLVLPSREEGLSNVILEAMAARAAVLASDVGGNPELVEHGRTGLLFASDDVQALAANLQLLSTDLEALGRLGASARDHAQCHYSVAALVDRTQSVYVRLLAGAGARQKVRSGPGAKSESQTCRGGSYSNVSPRWFDRR
ncbi:MAG: glycosyltransferase family 4 protein [Dokdonella sp.]